MPWLFKWIQELQIFETFWDQSNWGATPRRTSKLLHWWTLLAAQIVLFCFWCKNQSALGWHIFQWEVALYFSLEPAEVSVGQYPYLAWCLFAVDVFWHAKYMKLPNNNLEGCQGYDSAILGQRCVAAAKRAHAVLGCINREIVSKS